MIGPSCTRHSILTLASDLAVLYGNNAFSIFVLSTKKWHSMFLKKNFVFQKICFKVEVLKTFKASTNFHVKTCPSLKRRAILKIPSTVFRTYALSVGVKMKNLKRKRFPVLRQKPTKILRKNLLRGATIHFYCLFDKSHFSNICTH